jgi:Co/Zn/Cd efflux system component
MITSTSTGTGTSMTTTIIMMMGMIMVTAAQATSTRLRTSAVLSRLPPFSIVVAHVTYGLLANSVALLVDAGHNFGDVLGLLLAWGAHSVAQWLPTSRYT